MDYPGQLRDLSPGNLFFTGIDSDGCVFDSMEVKQKEFFIPNALKFFNLYRISRLLRETWEFVNLYSMYRGGNRFPAMIKTFELLRERKEVRESGCRLPDLSELKKWVAQETKLSNATLRKYYEEHPSRPLEIVLSWSEAVNREISEWLHDVPPFPHAASAMEMISGKSDIIVVSQTPLEALEREWMGSDLKRFVRIIAAQEHGTKKEHLEYAAKGKYPDDKILMIGDASGDLDAALANNVLFYPVIPGKEDLSWELFINEGFERFLSGKFKGSYQDSLISEFKRSLPEKPHWEN